MLTMPQIINQVISYMHDDTAEMQDRVLAWVNSEITRLVKMRPWQFLKASATITLTNGTGTFPADFGSLNAIVYGTTCLYPSDRLTDEYLAEEGYMGKPGFTQTLTGFTVYPSTDSITLSYQKAVPLYVATDTTILPDEMIDVIVRGALNAAYEFDMDERVQSSYQVYSQVLKEAKKWDNSLKGKPRRTNTIAWDNC